jgi:hypothetical protein
MKKIVVVTLFLLSPFHSFAQINTVSFKVDDVEVAQYDLMETTYKRAIERRIDRKIEGFPISKQGNWLVPTDFNAFVASVHFAYSEHRPLVLSPDIIWLTICQGLSIHINKNPEKYRDEIVRHKGKREILVVRDDFRKGQNNDWASSINTFTDSINKYVNKDFSDLVLSNFSTTNDIEKTAYKIALLESTSSYFSYLKESGCGIPKIILEGTTSDWQKIKEKLDYLRIFDLDIWVDNLLPIIDEFIDASNNKINLEFWRSIYKRSKHYNAFYPSGWIIKLFPYIHQWKVKKTKNGYNPFSSYELNPYIDGEEYRLSKITTDDFPSGISMIPFKWRYKENRKDKFTFFDMEAYAGFIGISQNKKTKALKAEIGWAIRDKKAPWLGVHDEILNSNFPMARLRNPIEYWLSEKVAKPDKWPIFMPDSCRTYKESIELLRKHISTEVAKLNKFELDGIVKIKFTVTWAGTIANIKIVKPGTDEENKFATEIIKELPIWCPAKKNWELKEYSVNFEQSVTIKFAK